MPRWVTADRLPIVWLVLMRKHFFLLAVLAPCLFNFPLQSFVLLFNLLALFLVVDYLLKKEFPIVLLTQVLYFELLVFLHQDLIVLVDFLSHLRHRLQCFVVRNFLVLLVFVALPLFICLLEVLFELLQVLIKL